MNKTDRLSRYLAYLIIIVSICINIWHLPMGFSSRDSSSWTGIIYRFAEGDAPIIHEWHPAQMSAILMIPFMKLFLAVTHSTDGVILYFRIIYTFLINLPAALYLFHKEKKHGYIISAALTSIVLLFSMGGEVMPDYNTMGSIFVLLFALLFTQPGPSFFTSTFLAGLFYAASVLCCPYLAVIYLIFIILCIAEKAHHLGGRNYYVPRLIPFTAGALSLAAIVIGFLLSKADPSSYLNSAGQLFRDPDHPTGRFLWVSQYAKLVKAVWRTTRGTIILFPLYAVFFVLVLLIPRNHQKMKYFLYGLLLLTIMLVTVYRDSIHNFAMVIFVPLGVAAMKLDDEHNKSLRNMYGIGIIYILMINLTSNTVLNAVSMASVICLIPSVLIFDDYLKKKYLNNRQIKILFVLSLSVLLGFMGIDRFTRIFQDEAPYTLKAKIEEGPLKGTVSTTEKVSLYNRQLDMIRKSIGDSEGAVFFFGENSWPYLVSERKYGTYALWFKEYRESDIYRLKEYWSIYPDRIPQTLYIMDDTLQYAETAADVMKQINPDIVIVDITEDELQIDIK